MPITAKDARSAAMKASVRHNKAWGEVVSNFYLDDLRTLLAIAINSSPPDVIEQLKQQMPDSFEKAMRFINPNEV